jgi:hypothetical protein
MTYTERQYAKLEKRRREKQEVKRRKREQREKRQRTYQELYRIAMMSDEKNKGVERRDATRILPHISQY